MDSKHTSPRGGRLHGVNRIPLRVKRLRTNSPTRKVPWGCREYEGRACLLGSADKEVAKSQRRDGSACTWEVEARPGMYQGAEDPKAVLKDRMDVFLLTCVRK